MAGRDWMPLKNEYAVTNTTLREMANKYDVPYNTIRDRSFKDKWGTARKEYRDKLMKSTIQKTASNQAAACAEQLSNVGKAAELATRAIERMMGDDQQFQRHTVQVRNAEGAQDVQERTFKKYDTKALREFARALKDLVNIIRDVYGLPTIKEQVAMDIAEKRLLLCEQKVHSESEEDFTVGVVFLPPTPEDKELFE